MISVACGLQFARKVMEITLNQIHRTKTNFAFKWLLCWSINHYQQVKMRLSMRLISLSSPSPGPGRSSSVWREWLHWYWHEDGAHSQRSPKFLLGIWMAFPSGWLPLNLVCSTLPYWQSTYGNAADEQPWAASCSRKTNWNPSRLNLKVWNSLTFSAGPVHKLRNDKMIAERAVNTFILLWPLGWFGVLQSSILLLKTQWFERCLYSEGSPPRPLLLALCDVSV